MTRFGLRCLPLAAHAARLAVAAALVAFGYVLGSADALSPRPLLAQGDDKTVDPALKNLGLSEELIAKLKSAHDAVKAAGDALAAENRYTGATKGTNSFAVLCGGLNPAADLETSQMVDPETFAALYADQATDEIAVHLSRDGDGHLTYKGKKIKLYPKSRLKGLYAARAALAGETTSEK